MSGLMFYLDMCVISSNATDQSLEESINGGWPADIHLIGKTYRFHAVYWPAMLISSGMSVPKKF